MLKFNPQNSQNLCSRWLRRSRGSNRITGNAGADYFVYAGSREAQVYHQSNLRSLDQITDWNVQEGNRLLIDTNDDGVGETPAVLFYAGRISASSLSGAVDAAYRDKNFKRRGQQKLQANEAVFLQWQGRTYLSVNDRSPGFAANRDLLLNVTGISIPNQTQEGYWRSTPTLADIDLIPQRQVKADSMPE